MSGTSDVDRYITNLPLEVKTRIEEIRKVIKEEVPECGEKISYGVPTATINDKYFIYYAGYKSHISIYPVTEMMEKSIKEIPEYRTGKGTLQFKLDKSLPMPLIRRIIKVRFKETVDKDAK